MTDLCHLLHSLKNGQTTPTLQNTDDGKTASNGWRQVGKGGEWRGGSWGREVLRRQHDKSDENKHPIEQD